MRVKLLASVGQHRLKVTRQAGRRALAVDALTAGRFSALPIGMQHSRHQAGRPAAASSTGDAPSTKIPVILFDVMDTIVKDPFYKHMPGHFNMSFKELLAAKHPTAWVEFERGATSEDRLLADFFSDGRSVDGDALKAMLISRYEFVPGMQQLLQDLRGSGYEMHAISNYPVWYRLIEEKLELSQYLSWTFMSCDGPMKGFRKPDTRAYDAVLAHLSGSAYDYVIVDDRAVNVEAAVAMGMNGVLFKDAEDCRLQLVELGVQLSPPGKLEEH